MNALGVLACATLLLLATAANVDPDPVRPTLADRPGTASATDSAVANFTAAMQRLVDLVGAAGGAILALVWARVALSWFSTDVTKKVQAKDRARDALVGSLIFVAALSGLVWGLAEWVLTGR